MQKMVGEVLIIEFLVHLIFSNKNNVGPLTFSHTFLSSSSFMELEASSTPKSFSWLFSSLFKYSTLFKAFNQSKVSPNLYPDHFVTLFHLDKFCLDHLQLRLAHNHCLDRNYCRHPILQLPFDLNSHYIACHHHYMSPRQNYNFSRFFFSSKYFHKKNLKVITIKMTVYEY